MAQARPLNGSVFDWKNEISNIFYNTKEAGSYYGPLKLYNVLRQQDSSCRLNDVVKWIQSQESYNIHRSKITKFERRQVVRLRPYETLTGDVVFLQDLSSHNSNYSYILTVLCIFSNKAWAYPLKKKTQQEVKVCLQGLFTELEGQIDNWWVDGGNEFDLDIYDQFNINKYSVLSPLHGCKIECFNKILENRIFRYMTANTTLRWVDNLNDLIGSYNETPSVRLYNLSPNECLLSPNKEFLKQKFKEERDARVSNHKKKKTDLKPGSFVYVAKTKFKFSRGYKPSFNSKVHKITQVLNTFPVTYRVSGLPRSYYRNELAVTTNEVIELNEKIYFIVEVRSVGDKTLRSGVISSGKKEYLIKSHLDKDYQEWVNETVLNELEDGKLLSNFDKWCKST